MRTAALALVLALTPGLGATGDAARELPPAQGSRLHFEKTLFVQTSDSEKIFSESHRVAPGESLWKILRRDYGISEAAMPSFLLAFRAVNPDTDPDRLAPGDIIRVPFKVEQRLAPESREPSDSPPTHTVRPGENLWKILRSTYGVARSDMGQALAAVASANPGIKDLNRLYAGQRISIPAGVVGRGAAPREAPPPLPATYRTVIDLLGELGCRVSDEGETFLPLDRGRTVRLDGSNFPFVAGPSGKIVVLDPRSRMTPALSRAVESSWGYRVVQGADEDPEVYLGRILPHLGFHELGEGVRTLSLGHGSQIKALARWTVVPRPEDLWEGRVHLFFPADSQLDGPLAAAVRRGGFVLHTMGAARAATHLAPPPPLARLRMDDPARGIGRVLSLLGVPHRLRPEVECSLGTGVRYRLRPPLTFRHGGLDYAVPPSSPEKAATLLSRSGHFPFPLPEGTSSLNALADVLALLGVPHARTTVEAPPGGALRVVADGIVLESHTIASFLYPAHTSEGKPGRLFLTEATLDSETAQPLFDEGLLPWLVVQTP